MVTKADLLQAIAGRNRGLLATVAEQQEIQVTTAQLEAQNPTAQPLEATELLSGNWRLLYTTSQSLLGFNRLPLAQLGQIYQCINTASARVYNIAEIQGPPLLSSIVSVAARFQPLSPSRVQVMFERSIIGLQTLVHYQSPSTWIQRIEAGPIFPALDLPLNPQNQQGWLEVTYLDQDLRISRGNEGSLFILARA